MNSGYEGELASIQQPGGPNAAASILTRSTPRLEPVAALSEVSADVAFLCEGGGEVREC